MCLPVLHCVRNSNWLTSLQSQSSIVTNQVQNCRRAASCFLNVWLVWWVDWNVAMSYHITVQLFCMYLDYFSGSCMPLNIEERPVTLASLSPGEWWVKEYCAYSLLQPPSCCFAVDNLHFVVCLLQSSFETLVNPISMTAVDRIKI
jgi:hypothetical protein